MSAANPNPETTGATGVGLATVTNDGTVLDTWFPQPKLTAEAHESRTERLSTEQAAEALG
ncbi:MAG: 2,3,4,5-tetrahydropyridine-2,6-dicarboxylate N-succinyltransferase, partial [Saccharomonospora viridis]